MGLIGNRNKEVSPLTPSILRQRLALYFVTPEPDARTLDLVAAALAGGATCVQLRSKHLDDGPCLELARRLAALCRAAGALFLLNDRVDVALAAGADGVHLGQTDLPVAEARRILGPGAVIGVSVETEVEAQAALAGGATYLATGPVYATATKADAGDPYGPAVVARIRAVAPGAPLVAIGGIGPGRAAPCIAAGADGVAVVAAIASAPDPAAAARALRAEVEAALAARRGR